MLLTASKLVLLNALLAAALPSPRLPLPKIPDAPNTPNTPNVPDSDIVNFENPSTGPVSDPGRWPPETQNPADTVDTPNNQNNPENPETQNPPTNTEPGQIEQPNSNQNLDLPACTINGKKRGDCTPNVAKWDRLPKQNGQTDNQFLVTGTNAIQRLDNIKTNPQPTKDLQSDAVMESRYDIIQTPNTNAGGPRILQSQKGLDPNDQTWTDYAIKNKDADIDTYIAAKKAEIDQTQSPDAITKQEQDLDAFGNDLKTQDEGKFLVTSISIDRQSMVIDQSFNAKKDLHRSYPRNNNAADANTDPNYRRPGSDANRPADQKEAVPYTDQMAYLLNKAYTDAKLDPRIHPIQNIVRRNIETVDTNAVLKAVLAKKGKTLDGPDDVVVVTKGEPEFAAIMGTIHGERMLQMMADFTPTFGPIRIKSVSIMRNQAKLDGSPASTEVPSSSPSRDSDVEDSEMTDVSDNEEMTDVSDSPDQPSSSPEQPSDDPNSPNSQQPSEDSSIVGDPREHDMLFEIEQF